MEKIYFENYYEISQTMICDNDLNNDTGLIGDFELVSRALEDILFTTDLFKIMNIELGTAECIGYDGPFLFSLTKDGEIWIQRAIPEGRDKIVFILEDHLYVQSKYVKDCKDINLNKHGTMYEICFEEEQDEDPKFHILSNDDGNPCGFEYHDENDGHCYKMKYCSCEPKDIEDIISLYNKVAENFTKWF